MLCEFFTDYPPTVNNYYNKTQRGVHISNKGRAFRDKVISDFNDQLAGMEPITGKVAIEVIAWPPDARKRDIDNIMKPIMDAMTHAGFWSDDSQVDQMTVYRGVKDAPFGSLYVKVKEAAPCIPVGGQYLLDFGE